MSDIETAHKNDRVRLHSDGAEGVVTDYVEPWSYRVLLDNGKKRTVGMGGLTNLSSPGTY